MLIRWSSIVITLVRGLGVFSDCSVLVASSHLQFSQIRSRGPYSIVRKIPYVIADGCQRGQVMPRGSRNITNLKTWSRHLTFLRMSGITRSSGGYEPHRH
jgi:hypothetical protein